jgi:hypothetical protein
VTDSGTGATAASVSRAALDVVPAEAADHAVVAGPAVHAVIAAAALQLVVAGATVEEVVAEAPEEHVGACAGDTSQHLSPSCPHRPPARTLRACKRKHP